MLTHLDLTWYSIKKIRSYAISHDLFINLVDTGIVPSSYPITQYLIPVSNLEKLIEGLGIAVTVDQLQEAAYDMRMQH